MISNQDMKAGRFLKLQDGKRIFNGIISHLKNNGIVYICTYTRATKLTKKHIGMIKISKNGSVYMQSGKKWNCIDYCGIKFN
jgi:hypothetical protein